MLGYWFFFAQGLTSAVLQSAELTELHKKYNQSPQPVATTSHRPFMTALELAALINEESSSNNNNCFNKELH